MNQDEFKRLYDERFPLYNRLADSVYGVVESHLNVAGVSYLNVSKRVKSLESAFEKVTRKDYIDPFGQIEDFCGLRIICYYPSDVDSIVSLLRQEFTVASEEDTQARLMANEFGYRSTHLVISLPEDWLRAPPYRGLSGLKAEIQVRTVLMHAWAEIQHKLAYKSVEQIPEAFQRKLFRLSAKFEEADEQLEDIRNGLSSYRLEVQPTVGVGMASLRDKDLNLDTLTILLDAAYPERDKSLSVNSGLLDELSGVSLTMGDLIDAIEALSPFVSQVERRHFGEHATLRWTQAGALRNALDIANDAFYSHRFSDFRDVSKWHNVIKYGRQLLGKPAS